MCMCCVWMCVGKSWSTVYVPVAKVRTYTVDLSSNETFVWQIFVLEKFSQEWPCTTLTVIVCMRFRKLNFRSCCHWLRKYSRFMVVDNLILEIKIKEFCIIILKLHLSVCPSVCLSVCDGKLPTFTGNRVDPEAFSPSHSGLEAASGTLWKAAT